MTGEEGEVEPLRQTTFPKGDKVHCESPQSGAVYYNTYHSGQLQLHSSGEEPPLHY